MDEKIGVGIVGLGLAATAHIRGYLSHPAAHVLAICDTDRKGSARLAAVWLSIQDIYVFFRICLADAM